MENIKKAYAISDAKISFVSLVDKAANKRQFLITKAEDGSANFLSTGRIIKADTDSHYVTGIVYEPMVEDSQGNYMTEEEITKAAHWFMKNAGKVDIQHCFEKANDCEVVESYVAKSDMTIDKENISKGTWLMTTEITDSEIWDRITKGEITGFSMGGIGVYSDEDVDLSADVSKSDEPKGLLKRLASVFGLETVEKKVAKPIEKAGKSLSNKNFEALKSINTALSEFLASFDDTNEPKTNTNTKEDNSVKKEEIQALITEEVTKALEPIQKAVAEAKGDVAAVQKESEPKESEITPETVAKMIGEEVTKALEPINKALEPILKSRVLPGNLNSDNGSQVSKAEEPHYMAGIF